MGLVLPFIANGLLRGECELSKQGIWLYAINTLGGVVGLLLVAGIALQTLGAGNSMIMALSFNLIVAGLAYFIHRNSTLAEIKETVTNSSEATSNNQWFRLALLLAFFSGFGVLALEILSLEMLLLFIPVSYHTPAAMLFTVILLLAVSSMIVPLLNQMSRYSLYFIFMIMIITGVVIVTMPKLFDVLTQEMQTGATQSPQQFLGQLILFSLLALGPSFLFAGFVFPMIFSWYGKVAHDIHAKKWGLLLAINGFGGLLGAEIAYRVLLPNMGVYYGICSIGLFYLVMVLVLQFRKNANSDLVEKSIPVIAMVVAFVLIFVWVKPLSLDKTSYGFVVIDRQHGRDGNVSVVEHADIGRGILMSNHYMLGSNSVKYDQERQTHIPLLLHSQPKDVGFIALATGISSGGALLHPVVESIESVELSGLVVRAADLYFQEDNHGITQHEKARIVVEDGRTYFAACQNRYDVIVGDLFVPWGMGEARLYSVEHFQAIKDALKKGGIFCQWLAMYQLTPEQFKSIAKTFQSVFGNVVLFRNTFTNAEPALGLVGFKESSFDWDVVAKRCKDALEQNLILDPTMRHLKGVQMLSLGHLEDLQNDSGISINTLNNMFVELNASQVRMVDDFESKYMYRDAWVNYLVDRWNTQLNGKYSPSHQQMMGLGIQFSEWDRAIKYRHPKAALLQQACIGNMPKEIMSDMQADWAQWPFSKRIK